MKFKQFYLGCLAHASYYIGSGTEAAIIATCAARRNTPNEKWETVNCNP